MLSIEQTAMISQAQATWVQGIAAIAQTIAAIILIFVTGRYVKLTKEMAYQTRRAIDEPRRKEIEQAFQTLFMALRKDIVAFDALYNKQGVGELRIIDPSNKEDMQKLVNYVENIAIYSDSKIDNIFEKVLLNSSLFKEIDNIRTLIMHSFNEVKKFLQNIDSYADKNGIINQHIPQRLLFMRFHLRQIACYFICEAEYQGYKELAGVMKEIEEFEPDRTMIVLEKFHPTELPDELKKYDCCNTKNLVQRAQEKSDQNSVMASLSAILPQ